MEDINTGIYQIKQLRCFQDGEELKFKDIKKAIKTGDYNEIYIFSISNKLYKDIINFLTENEIKYQLYGRSRIVLENYFGKD